MIGVLQDNATRKWGCRVTEAMESFQVKGIATSYRPLLESFEFSSIQEVMEFCNQLKQSLGMGRYRMRKDGGIWMYEIAYPDQNTIMYSEGGWMDQTELSEHIQLLQVHCSGEPKLVNAPKPVNISIGDRPSGPPRMQGVEESFEDWSKVDQLTKEEDSEESIAGPGWK